MIFHLRKRPQLARDRLGTHLLRNRNPIRFHFSIGVVRTHAYVETLGKRKEHKLYFAAAIGTGNIESLSGCQQVGPHTIEARNVARTRDPDRLKFARCGVRLRRLSRPVHPAITRSSIAAIVGLP